MAAICLLRDGPLWRGGGGGGLFQLAGICFSSRVLANSFISATPLHECFFFLFVCLFVLGGRGGGIGGRKTYHNHHNLNIPRLTGFMFKQIF